MNPKFEKLSHSIQLQGTALEVSTIQRSGTKAPVVFLHGFGCTKEDYADFVFEEPFEDRRFLAYDAPGCGETQCSDLSKPSIPFLVETAVAMLDRSGIERCHLVGHSMGGLTGLMLADSNPGRVLSYTSIEGNLSEEDCFLSKQPEHYPDLDADAFFTWFKAWARHLGNRGSAIYASGLDTKVRPEIVRGVFGSMVELSKNGNLIDRFLGLPCPKMFMYGEQNKCLKYIKGGLLVGARVVEIEECGHFPMYSNAPAMWEKLADFIEEAEKAPT
ncbi:MAG: alpha/beta hydrolase [Pseudomonadota bacterium]